MPSNQVGCSAHQTESDPVTMLLVSALYRPVNISQMLHMASGDLAADLTEDFTLQEQTSLDLLFFNKLKFPNSVNNKALDNSSIKLSGESKSSMSRELIQD